MVATSAVLQLLGLLIIDLGSALTLEDAEGLEALATTGSEEIDFQGSGDEEWRALDEDSSGFLEASELSDLGEQWKIFDQNKDGKLSKTEVYIFGEVLADENSSIPTSLIELPVEEMAELTEHLEENAADLTELQDPCELPPDGDKEEDELSEPADGVEGEDKLSEPCESPADGVEGELAPEGAVSAAEGTADAGAPVTGATEGSDSAASVPETTDTVTASESDMDPLTSDPLQWDPLKKQIDSPVGANAKPHKATTAVAHMDGLDPTAIQSKQDDDPVDSTTSTNGAQANEAITTAVTNSAQPGEADMTGVSDSAQSKHVAGQVDPVTEPSQADSTAVIDNVQAEQVDTTGASAGTRPSGGGGGSGGADGSSGGDDRKDNGGGDGGRGRSGGGPTTDGSPSAGIGGAEPQQAATAAATDGATHAPMPKTVAKVRPASAAKARLTPKAVRTPMSPAANARPAPARHQQTAAVAGGLLRSEK